MYMRGFSPPDLAVIIPSTGRAEQCARLVERIHETATNPVKVVISVEQKDVRAYADVRWPGGSSFTGRFYGLVSESIDDDFPGTNHVAAMNRAQRWLLGFPGAPTGLDPKIIVKMDDDHWPVTNGWDLDYLDALAQLGGTGVVYGNDLFQGEALPTVPGISADIVRELGWYAPPQLGHLFCDNFWLELGRRAGRLRYLPATIIEHRHPQAGKADRDQVYAAGGESKDRWAADRTEWDKIIAQGHTVSDMSLMDQWAGRVRDLALPKIEVHQSHWYALTSADLPGASVRWRCGARWSDGTACDHAWVGSGRPGDGTHRRAVSS
jgi:hypothetical protein